ncbi:LPXTG cell wall anchor domain-containing protein [Apilactobacillus micheneri]|uniref:LPXTG cell wall anchor domain-containing protein n=1 Tax=Apilactobacillus micheneri TaxID=1899430 RepID=A0A9Q8INZ9_9LACO|nr:LPXTG cell wall anchor domain-containing protein [Apilactobacillus micheneri]TPR39900.1 LPXTG cell wall anchor domain-containing protein [Apilactobacillus micheneri]TPR43821.1 LPXTG cell wall anchor domain-containing protein [Apilactobacillus micheneri]TPR45374.1 LPXTG cell wall anchor domain-containing protein [Apilactobacillus micheneri]
MESVKGTKDNSITDNSWMINKYGWISHNDPNKIIWNINFNPANNNIKNVKLSDILSPNQTFLGNVSATSGHVDTNNDNQFISDNQSIPVSVNNNNGHLDFNLNNGGAINKDVSLVYETQFNQSSNNSLSDATNNVTISAQNNVGNASDNSNPNFISQSVGARILSGGYGIANGNQTNHTVTEPNESHNNTTNLNNSTNTPSNNYSNSSQSTPVSNNNQHNNNSFTPVHENSNDVKTNNSLNDNKSSEKYATTKIKIPNQLSHSQNNNLNIPIHNKVSDMINNNHKLPNDNKDKKNSGNNKNFVVNKELKHSKKLSYKKNVISHPTVKPNNQHNEPNMFINNKTQKLPQTGNSDNNLSLIGLLMLSISTIFFAIFKHRY